MRADPGLDVRRASAIPSVSTRPNVIVGQGTLTRGFDGVSDIYDGGFYSGTDEGQIRKAPWA